MKQNYQKALEDMIEKHQKAKEVPTLYMHSCCAPCSSYVLEYLSQYFQITVFYYNPNIYPEEEYDKRVEEQKNFIRELPTKHKIQFEIGDYDKEQFYKEVRGLEDLQEGGERCFRCYEMRLLKAAVHAKERGMDYFTTTLSISPRKNADKLNEIGERLEKKYGIRYLKSDFKKKNGYRRSVELSKQYGLYRQDYCGCIFSQRKSKKVESE
ncbi:epoxyqueuosine reductase QueH [Lachnospiraceae bacterium ZAX-1]